MVGGTRTLLSDAAGAISKALSDILVCPLSKQPLRYCKDSQRLVSDSIGVSFPVVDGVPYLTPTDGKLIDDSGLPNADNSSNSVRDHQK